MWCLGELRTRRADHRRVFPPSSPDFTVSSATSDGRGHTDRAHIRLPDAAVADDQHASHRMSISTPCMTYRTARHRRGLFQLGDGLMGVRTVVRSSGTQSLRGRQQIRRLRCRRRDEHARDLVREHASASMVSRDYVVEPSRYRLALLAQRLSTSARDGDTREKPRGARPGLLDVGAGDGPSEPPAARAERETDASDRLLRSRSTVNDGVEVCSTLTI